MILVNKETVVMMSSENIKQLILNKLPGAEIIVKGDDGRHFEALVIDNSFEGMKQLRRQQLVYDAVGDRIKNGEIHALSLKTYSQNERLVR